MKFFKQDFCSTDFFKTYDYIFASGPFNHRLSDNIRYIEFVIEKMWLLAKKGVAFNLLSENAPLDYRFSKAFFYYSPSKILEFCFKYTKKVMLNHSYAKHDFTIFMYK